MKKLITVILLMAVMLSITSCARLLSGQNQRVRFESNVDGAKVMLNIKDIGTTNTYIDINRADLNKLIRVSKEGCKTKELEMPIMLNEYYWANLGFCLLAPFPAVGWIALAPAMYDFSWKTNQKTDNVIRVDLDCTSSQNNNITQPNLQITDSIKKKK
ncbi:MAG: hypothetical protein NTX03_11600 [Bacteroidetes bacterium]|nr:hypothetical protein [Bacteroidota bacterium]